MAEKEINTILFFTGSYPYSSAAEDTFIDPEIPYLKLYFNSVIIIPKSLEGKREDLPTYITIETTLGQILKPRRALPYKIQTIILSITSFIFYKEILKKSNKILHIQSIIKIINFLGGALRTKKWIIRYIEDNSIDLANTVFYTYWLDEITMGISLAKMQYPDIKIVSRAHGADLYEERHYPAYIPFRPEIFKYLNKIYSVSERGVAYLSIKYPKFRSLFYVSRLGISEQNFVTDSSNDGIFRIVSCSYLVPIKRIELLIKGLEELGKTQKENIFEWIHIGDGPLKYELEQYAFKQLPQNIRYKFLGYLPNKEVLSYYETHKIDVFINVSSLEGTPVSIMEAQSCSIPVIATAVGGNAEIVSDENGLLLNENPTPFEIAQAICEFLDNPTLTREKKYMSRKNWETYYNSEKNFQAFADELIKQI